MTQGYLTLRDRGRAEIVVRKSKFIATASPVAAEDDAQGLVDEVRREFWDATHNVYAFVVGEHNEIARSSDDASLPARSARLEVAAKMCITAQLWSLATSAEHYSEREG